VGLRGLAWVRVATFVSVLAALVTLARAQDSSPGPTYDRAMGIALEELSYPYPVSFLPLVIEGHPSRMAYMDVAPTAAPNGRTAMLLHGKNFDSGYWGKTIASLAAHGFRVVVPDQIGFNKSSKPEIDYSFDLLAANTVRLLDHLGVGPVDLVGHSTGGMLAVRLARAYPERVAHLVLEDPIGLEDYRLKIPPQTTERLTEDELHQTPEQYRAFVRRYFVSLPPADYERVVEWRARVALSAEFDRWAQVSALLYQMIYRQPVRYEYPLLRPPTLLVVGAEDRTVVMRQYGNRADTAEMGNFPVLAQAACREMARCELIVMPQTGHVPHLEHPDAFIHRLLGFLNSNAGSAADRQ
jgi:pimeloyl-ACP methyl ester carboxylesterase